MSKLPERWQAPCAIHQLEGNCGVMTAWGVLRYLRKRTAAARLVKSCRYTRKHGTFVIALAVAFREHGLSVDFYSDPDPSPQPIERRCYPLAEKLGVRMHPALELHELLAQVGPHRVAIVNYDVSPEAAHLSPILPRDAETVHLPYAEVEQNEIMGVAEFVRLWSAPEIYRQCLVVTREGRFGRHSRIHRKASVG